MSLSIVQSVATGNHSGGASEPALTWSDTPAEGDLLVVSTFCGTTDAPAPETGWIVLSNHTGANWRSTVYGRIAGSDETTTPTIDTTSLDQWSLGAWEISGGSVSLLAFNLSSGNIGTSGDSSYTVPSFNLNAQQSLILGFAGGNSATASLTRSFTSGTEGEVFTTASADGSGTYEFALAYSWTGESGSFSPVVDFSESSSSNIAWSFVEITSVAPWIDSPVYSEGGASVSSLAVSSVNTLGSEDVIVAIVSYTAGASGAAVSGISGGSLSWSQRAQYPSGGAGDDGTAIEEWWAPAASALSDVTVTVSFTEEIQYGAAYVYGVGGTYDYASPWDTNASLAVGASKTVSDAEASFEYSTSQPQDFLIAAITSGDADNEGSISGWTSIATTQGGGDYAFVINSLNVSETQSDQDATWTSLNGETVIGFVDALSASNPTGSGGGLLPLMGVG